jgi:hypothetical protein
MLRYENDVQVFWDYEFVIVRYDLMSFDACCGWDLIYVFDTCCGWNLSYANCLRKWHVELFMFYEESMY